MTVHDIVATHDQHQRQTNEVERDPPPRGTQDHWNFYTPRSFVKEAFRGAMHRGEMHFEPLSIMRLQPGKERCLRPTQIEAVDQVQDPNSSLFKTHSCLLA